MKALVYHGARSMGFEERPEPKAGPGDVIVKVKYCGICGSDLHAYVNGSMPTGIIFGHEVVGVVAQIGQGVQGWRTGERVVVQASGSCNECYCCRHGQPNLCVHAFERTNGISPGYDGGLAKSNGRFRTDGLVSDIINLDEAIEKGFEQLATSKGLVKIVVAP
jgi:threonine dehydrogenase-like Zn-dependent dehydrogenase